MMRTHAFRLALCLLFVTACDRSTPQEPISRRPASLAALSGEDQVSRVRSTLEPFHVQAVTSGGVALSGIDVEWTITDGSGSLSHARSTTQFALNADGSSRPLASSTLTLGDVEESYTVSARLPGHRQVAPAVFRAVSVSEVVRVQASAYWECYSLDTCIGRFVPANLQVPVGATVGWIWTGAACDVTFEDDPTLPVSSGMQERRSHLRTFTEPGNYRYRCTLYSSDYEEGMVGIVTVQ